MKTSLSKQSSENQRDLNSLTSSSMPSTSSQVPQIQPNTPTTNNPFISFLSDEKNLSNMLTS